MGYIRIDPDHVDVRFTQEFEDSQRDERFQGWLRWRRTGHDVGFDGFDATDVVYLGQDFTQEGLREAEARALDRFSKENRFLRRMSGEDFDLAMHVVWYIGQVFVENLEGRWVAVPRPERSATAADPLVDLPFDTGFINPMDLFEIGLLRRTGNQWSRAYGFQQKHYEKWFSEGRPKRVFPGLVPTEDDIPDPLPKLVDQKAVKKRIADAEKERKGAAKQKAEDEAPQATLSGDTAGAGAAAAGSTPETPKPKPAPQPQEEEEEWEPPASWLQRS